MKVKKFVVKNMNEAMARIRNELGKDAIIVSQRKIRKEGIKGYFTPKLIEVTAALDKYNNNERQSMDSIKALIYNKQEEQKKALIKKENLVKNDKVIENAEDSNNSIIKEVIEMKKMIKELQNNNAIEDKENSVIDSFVDNLDISIESKKRIIEEIEKIDTEVEVEEKFKKALEKIVPEYEDKEKKIEILIGPTGVGKTTTIAKLAGSKALLEKKKVGLITIDTYRIGAVEQLKTYSEIMNIPFKVVYSIKEMDDALE